MNRGSQIVSDFSGDYSGCKMIPGFHFATSVLVRLFRPDPVSTRRSFFQRQEKKEEEQKEKFISSFTYLVFSRSVYSIISFINTTHLTLVVRAFLARQAFS